MAATIFVGDAAPGRYAHKLIFADGTIAYCTCASARKLLKAHGLAGLHIDDLLRQRRTIISSRGPALARGAPRPVIRLGIPFRRDALARLRHHWA